MRSANVRAQGVSTKIQFGLLDEGIGTGGAIHASGSIVTIIAAGDCCPQYVGEPAQW